MGRHKKTEEEVHLAGTARADRPRADLSAMTIPVTVFPCPQEYSPETKKAWYLVIPPLMAIKAISEQDKFFLIEAFKIYNEAQDFYEQLLVERVNANLTGGRMDIDLWIKLNKAWKSNMSDFNSRILEFPVTTQQRLKMASMIVSTEKDLRQLDTPVEKLMRSQTERKMKGANGRIYKVGQGQSEGDEQMDKTGDSPM